MAVAAIALVLGCAAAADDRGATAVPEAPGAEPSASWRLSYRIPRGWVSSPDRARAMELAALLLPEGQTREQARAFITVEFQRKYPPGVPLPSTLEQFFQSRMRGLVMMFPELRSERWRPASLDRMPTEVASLEVRDIVPGPLRFVMIDVGDGFYNVAVTATRQEALDGEDVALFFDSLLLLPSGR